MKIRKTAIQKNFIVDSSYYTQDDLKKMLRDGIVFHIDNEIDEYECPVYRIPARELKEVKVVCKAGYYCTVVIMQDDREIFVSI